LLPSLVRGLQK